MRKSVLYPLAVSAAIGLIASVVFCLIMAWETVGGVALVVAPLFLVSVVLVFFLEVVSTNKVVKYVAFVFPLALILGATAYAMWCDTQAIKNTGVCDGGGDIAQFVLTAYLVGLATACVCLIALDRREWKKNGNKDIFDYSKSGQ